MAIMKPQLSTGKKLIFSAVMTVLVLATINGVVVLREKQKYGVTAQQKESMYQTTQTGRRVLKAGSTMQGSDTKVNINSMGFRGPELKNPKPKNGFRIWAIGGSTTFDVFAPDDANTWPALLGAELAKRHPDRVVEVINAGIPGEVIAGNLQDLKQHAAAAQPDLLVYYHGPNDLRDLRFGGPPPPSGALEQQFALLRAARGAVNQRYPTLPNEWNDVRLSSHDLNEMTRRIDQVLNNAKQMNIPVMMTSHAYQHTPGKTGREAIREVGEICVLMQMGPDNVVHMFRDYNNLVKGIAERRGLPFADVQAAIPSDSQYWGDALHFKVEGSRLAAMAMVKAAEIAGNLQPQPAKPNNEPTQLGNP